MEVIQIIRPGMIEQIKLKYYFATALFIQLLSRPEYNHSI